jgi:hypothetical protein
MISDAHFRRLMSKTKEVLMILCIERGIPAEPKEKKKELVKRLMASGIPSVLDVRKAQESISSKVVEVETVMAPRKRRFDLPTIREETNRRPRGHSVISGRRTRRYSVG